MHIIVEMVDLSVLTKDIVATRAFTRIRDVSFLGIVDRFNTHAKVNRPAFSRADHSLGVLQLGIVAARRMELDVMEGAHLIAACLTHDIGHPPFSHSLEYAFPKERRAWDHHREMIELLRHPSGTERGIVRVLQSHGVSSERLISIVSGRDPLSFFFDAPINLDTLDGINRSMWSFGFFPNYDIRLLAANLADIYAGRTVTDETFRRHADAFWISKGTFYRFIDSNSDLARVERHFQKAVRLRIPALSRSLFRLTDREFSLRYPEILGDTSKSTDVDIPTESQEFVVDSEIYAVDKNTINKRYIRKKNEIFRSGVVPP